MAKKPPPLRLMVSSTVYGSESFLTQVYATLAGYGYDTWMSHVGTIPVTSSKSNLENCLQAVAECDAFIGIITGWYGSGKEDSGLSYTHREMRTAVELNKPRWFLVQHDVIVARQLLRQFRFRADGKTKKKLVFKPTAILDDIRILDLYEEVIRLNVPTEIRKGNWAQPYASEADALRYIEQQLSNADRVRAIVEDSE